MWKEWFVWLNEPTNISTGFAGLVASFVVAVGWLINARKERRFSRIDKAHDTLLVKNEKFMANLKIIKPRLDASVPIPSHLVLETTEEGKRELQALRDVLNELETLGLDISTGRGSELYTIETQRSLICDIMVRSQQHIETLRVARGHRRLLKNLENLFIRLYFNRYPFVQTAIEVIVGRPAFGYSHLNFRLRYMITCWALGEPWEYHGVPYPKIRERTRVLRRILMGFWCVAGLVAIFAILRFYFPP